MISRRRKRSAYLEYDDSNDKIKSVEPNSVKEKVKTKIISHKKESNLTGKDILSFLLFIILTIIFILFLTFFIHFIQVSMNVKTSDYKVSKTITEKTEKINTTSRKKKEEITENMNLLVSTINSYNHEISSIYSDVKGYIIVYYDSKEGPYVTTRSISAVSDRVNLDLKRVKNDKILNNYSHLQDLYIQRFENIKKFCNSNLPTRDNCINVLNTYINEENKLDGYSRATINQILNNNNIHFKIQENTYKIIN